MAPLLDLTDDQLRAVHVSLAIAIRERLDSAVARTALEAVPTYDLFDAVDAVSRHRWPHITAQSGRYLLGLPSTI